MKRKKPEDSGVAGNSEAVVADSGETDVTRK